MDTNISSTYRYRPSDVPVTSTTYYGKHYCDTDTEVLLSWRTNVSSTDRDTDPVTLTSYFQQHYCDTDTELMLSWRTKVSPTDSDTETVKSTTYAYYQPQHCDTDAQVMLSWILTYHQLIEIQTQ